RRRTRDGVAAAPISDTVSGATAPVSDTVSSATAPVTDAVTGEGAPISDTVSGATAPITDTVTGATSPISDTVAGATAPISDTVAGMTAPVADLVGHAPNSLDGSAAAGTSTIVEPAAVLEVATPAAGDAGVVNATVPAVAGHSPAVIGEPTSAADAGYQAMSPADSTDSGWVASMLHALNPLHDGSVSITHLMATSSLALRLAL